MDLLSFTVFEFFSPHILNVYTKFFTIQFAEIVLITKDIYNDFAEETSSNRLIYASAVDTSISSTVCSFSCFSYAFSDGLTTTPCHMVAAVTIPAQTKATKNIKVNVETFIHRFVSVR